MTTPEQRYEVVSTVVETLDENNHEGMGPGESEVVSHLTGNDIFDARVRAVLGVTDPAAPVLVERIVTTSGSHEFAATVLSCAGRSFEFAEATEFFDALDEGAPILRDEDVDGARPPAEVMTVADVLDAHQADDDPHLVTCTCGWRPTKEAGINYRLFHEHQAEEVIAALSAREEG